VAKAKFCLINLEFLSKKINWPKFKVQIVRHSPKEISRSKVGVIEIVPFIKYIF